jgi:hypothetical protein
VPPGRDEIAVEEPGEAAAGRPELDEIAAAEVPDELRAALPVQDARPVEPLAQQAG